MNESDCLLTIITAVYNGEDYIKETIDSVLENALNVDFEYLVINDGSTDKTREIIESFGSKIKVINKENSGESATLTMGFELAGGEFILVVSADDPLFTPRIFENIFEKFDEEKDIVAIYPDWRMIDENGKILKQILVREYSDELLIGRCQTLPGPGTIFRTDVANEIGGRRSKWRFVGDYDFWLRLSRKGQLKHRPEVVAQWRLHSNSTSISLRGLEMANERIQVIEEFLSQNTITAKISRMAKGNAYFMAARLAFFDPRITGKKYLVNSFIYRRGWVEEARIYILIYILLTPFSRLLYQKISRIHPTLRTLK